jgi:transposase
VSLDINELNAVLARAEGRLDESDHEKLRLSVEGFVELRRLLEDKRMTIQRLRQLLFGARTEKSREGLADPHDASAGDEDTPPRKGHGRRRAQDYTGAECVELTHPALCSGQSCPHCEHGKVYTQREPGVLVRIVGQAPLGATSYALEKLRCNLCGEVFTAPPPPQAGTKKYAESAASMIAVLKYGSGFPFNRLANVQAHLGVPVAPSTQWDIVKRAAEQLGPVHDELIRHSAQVLSAGLSHRVFADLFCDGWASISPIAPPVNESGMVVQCGKGVCLTTVGSGRPRGRVVDRRRDDSSG